MMQRVVCPVFSRQRSKERGDILWVWMSHYNLGIPHVGWEIWIKRTKHRYAVYGTKMFGKGGKLFAWFKTFREAQRFVVAFMWAQATEHCIYVPDESAFDIEFAKWYAREGYKKSGDIIRVEG